MFIQEFSCWASLGEVSKDNNNKRSFIRHKFHVTVVERATPFADIDPADFDSEELVISMARSISYCALKGYQIADIGKGNWGAGVRNPEYELLKRFNTVIEKW